jgi:Ni/Co efflux regulator RcnB
MKTKTRLLSVLLAVPMLVGTAGAVFAAPWDRDDFGHREVFRDAPRHEFMRGERFVPDRRFVEIRDWRGMHLRRPAVGLHWVRAGANFLLINERTGRIVDVVLAP